MGGTFEEGVKVLGHDDLTLEVSLRCLLKSCQCVGLHPCELACVDARDSTDPNRSVSEFQEDQFEPVLSQARQHISSVASDPS